MSSGSTTDTSIYNSTSETVKVCLIDTDNNQSDRILSAGELWCRKTVDGWNTIIIIPLNPKQNTFSYTLPNEWGVIIKRKLEQLVLIPAVSNSRKTEADVTMRSHNCYMPPPCRMGNLNTEGMHDCCHMIGCLVYNESHEPIRVCVTDKNNRNSHMLLNHGEHNEINTPQEASFIQKLFTSPSNHAPMVLVSVLDFQSDNQSANTTARAKYTIKSYFHERGNGTYTFLRVIKKNGYFTIEEDSIRYSIPRRESKLSYLFSKDCCEKFRTYKNLCDIVDRPDGTFDVEPRQTPPCSIL
ncbi:unnamed protein product [Adineta steineri]|uniref:Uncharacterized protein n=1 Tax=Adineta steineri TaxID=433720 RepID=A0A814I255_9BILA|nr:unnamed protein product [Adineta steineri]CAF1007899.1 unnamed protein product [Adineta steineri]CAF1017197.1 unnamed protein product [Adineta steineri]